jgi:hypothetical protein
VHLGKRVGEIACRTCPETAGKAPVAGVHLCDYHARCTIALPIDGLQCCARCGEHKPEWESDSAGGIRHLTYHVLPTGNAWKWNMDQLRGRLSLFNGRRIVSVAVDPEAESVDAVRAELAGLDVEIWETPNDRNRKEMSSFPKLVEALSSYTDKRDTTFYAHAKGVTSEMWAPGSRRWSTAMYSALLDYWPAVRRELKTASVVGIYRRFNCGVPDSLVKWHFSGTFRWTRNQDLYKRDWRRMDQGWCGSESYPAVHFSREETACLHSEFGQGGLGLYLDETWQGWANASRETWEREHEPDRFRPLLVTVILTAHAQPERVHEAIASVQAQTTDSWQCLIVDSGRIAATGAYQRYATDARIQVMLTNETPEQARSIGIQAWAINEAWRRGRVRGDLVLHLCDDDVLDPDVLETWMATARREQHQSAWYGRAVRSRVHANGEEEHLGELGLCGVSTAGRYLDCKTDGMQVCHRRSLATAWPEERAVAWHADGLWMSSIADRCPIYPVDVLVGRHRHTAESTFTQQG